MSRKSQGLSRKDLYAYDDFYNVEESVMVSAAHDFSVEHYLSGRCHLMALVMAQETGMALGVFIDQYALEDADGAPVAALEHAFCHLPGNGNDLVDARGTRSRADLLNDYCFASNEPCELAGEEALQLIESWISNGLLEDFLPSERESITQYVREMKALDLFTAQDVDANPPHVEILPSDSAFRPF
jgi:hypothetical protein